MNEIGGWKRERETNGRKGETVRVTIQVTVPALFWQGPHSDMSRNLS